MVKYIVNWANKVHDASDDSDIVETYGCEPFRVEADSPKEAADIGNTIVKEMFASYRLEGRPHSISGPFDAYVTQILDLSGNVLYKMEG